MLLASSKGAQSQALADETLRGIQIQLLTLSVTEHYLHDFVPLLFNQDARQNKNATMCHENGCTVALLFGLDRCSTNYIFF